MKEIKQDTAHKRLKQMEAMVIDVIPETWDTFTLLLFTGNDMLNYQAGHFITIDPHQFPGIQRWTHYLEDLKGKKEPPRAYSLFSAPHEKYLAITVKEEAYVSGVTPYPPLLSPILAKRTPRGTPLTITGFTGPYTFPDKLKKTTDTVVHICAGSGVVPSMSIIKASLRNDESIRHVLVYSNKTRADMIFHNLLGALEREHPARFQVHYFLTREKKRPDFSPRVYTGRVSQPVLTGIFKELENPLVYVCGPANTPHEKREARQGGQPLKPKFMESVLAVLEGLHIDRKRIKFEGWG